MGCYTSRQATDDGSSYPPQVPSASARNITAPSPARQVSIATPRGSHSHPTTEHWPNVPLRPLDATLRSTLPAALLNSPAVGSHHPTMSLSDSAHNQWTRRRLEKERGDWWDTRTTASPEIWRALRLIVENLQAGEVDEAQALLDAIECTCPTGTVWRGVFDARGELYKVEEWLVLEPEGLVEDVPVDEVAGRNSEEVDKEGQEVLGEPAMVKCRLSSNSQDYTIGIRKGERVAVLVTKLKSKAGINPFAFVRLVYGGKIYDENQPLESHENWNYESKHVLIAMVFE